MAQHDQQNANPQPNAVPQPLQAIENSSAMQRVEGSAAVQKGLKPAAGFFKKFNNDWAMNLQAGALAYGLLVAIFPIAVALLSLLGLVLGGFAKGTQQSFIQGIEKALPSQAGVSSNVIDQIFQRLSNASGFLGIVAIIVAVFGGSRLFVLIEYCFDIIYHQRQRTFLKQNIMAIGMLLLFVVLIPIMIFASSGPAIVFSLLQNTPLKSVPGSGFIFSLGGILGSLIVSWILFEAIYIIVPNQRISFRNSWRGAVFAAIALQIYLTLFPLYITHFLGGYAGQVGFALILIIFFYYFGVILLLGAEFNAYFAEGIQATPDNIAGIIHKETSHDPKPPAEQQREAPPSHRNQPPPGR